MVVEIQERMTWGKESITLWFFRTKNKLNLHYKKHEGTLSSSVERAPRYTK